MRSKLVAEAEGIPRVGADPARHSVVKLDQKGATAEGEGGRPRPAGGNEHEGSHLRTVSTRPNQHTEQQITELRRCAGVPRVDDRPRIRGPDQRRAKESRPALDAMSPPMPSGVEFGVVCVWRLDHLGRNLKH